MSHWKRKNLENEANRQECIHSVWVDALYICAVNVQTYWRCIMIKLLMILQLIAIIYSTEEVSFEKEIESSKLQCSKHLLHLLKSFGGVTQCDNKMNGRTIYLPKVCLVYALWSWLRLAYGPHNLHRVGLPRRYTIVDGATVALWPASFSRANNCN